MLVSKRGTPGRLTARRPRHAQSLTPLLALLLLSRGRRGCSATRSWNSRPGVVVCRGGTSGRCPHTGCLARPAHSSHPRIHLRYRRRLARSQQDPSGREEGVGGERSAAVSSRTRCTHWDASRTCGRLSHTAHSSSHPPSLPATGTTTRTPACGRHVDPPDLTPRPHSQVHNNAHAGRRRRLRTSSSAATAPPRCFRRRRGRGGGDTATHRHRSLRLPAVHPHRLTPPLHSQVGTTAPPSANPVYRNHGPGTLCSHARIANVAPRFTAPASHRALPRHWRRRLRARRRRRHPQRRLPN